MKFQPETTAGANVITRHETGRIWVGAQAFDHSLVVPWVGEVRPWNAAGFDALGEAQFESLLALQPELVIFGSGARLRFARPQWLRPLIERRIGVESMDTAAACRTYNVLVSEQRCVVAVLLLESGAS